MNNDYPSYLELTGREAPTAGTSWGLFPDAQRGTPSFAGAAEVVHACSSVRSGSVFGLDYPVDAFTPGMSAARSAPKHTIYSNHTAHRDDFLDGFYLQGSSQIDGLRHRRSDEIGFYGGIDDEAIRVGTPDLGIQTWADAPIVTRGVLLDVARHRERAGAPIDHWAGEPLSVELLQEVAASQNTSLIRGDLLMIRTGWCEWFLNLPYEAKLRLKASRLATGIAQSKDFVAWVWDQQLAMVAADNFAVERLPPLTTSPYLQSAPSDTGMMHQELLAKLGMPLGELWRLDQLARYMQGQEQWDALIIVKPLNITGATGSPANATAIC